MFSIPRRNVWQDESWRIWTLKSRFFWFRDAPWASCIPSLPPYCKILEWLIDISKCTPQLPPADLLLTLCPIIAPYHIPTCPVAKVIAQGITLAQNHQVPNTYWIHPSLSLYLHNHLHLSPKLTRQPLSLSFAPRLPPLQLILKHQPDYAIPLHKSFNSFLFISQDKNNLQNHSTHYVCCLSSLNLTVHIALLSKTHAISHQELTHLAWNYYLPVLDSCPFL